MTTTNQRRPPHWAKRLLDWYAENHRSLPWRESRIPYAIWVSEIMLQQTQVDTVIPYFNRFIERFPTVADLASAELQHVLKLWEGLGYYSRARHLHRAANAVVTDWNGHVPTTMTELKTLPGLGDYTAAAVASIAFDEPVAAVDGNVLRVFARFWGIDDDIKQKRVRDTVAERLEPVIETVTPSIFNQALMELGALICRPRTPQCTDCPLQRDCIAYTDDRTNELPRKVRRKPVPHRCMLAAVIHHDNHLLLHRRSEHEMLGGLWHFPSTENDDNSHVQAVLPKSVSAQTGLSVTVGACIGTVRHVYSHFSLELTPFHCQSDSARIHSDQPDNWQWHRFNDIKNLPCDKATTKILGLLAQSQDLIPGLQ